MGDNPRQPDAEPPQAPGERLESWKEIAAYLRRDVRTVQRWEQSDGLPVHRHKRAARPIPYAYKAELDAWWTGRAWEAAPVPELPPAGGALWSQRPHVALLGVALIAIVMAAGYWALTRPRSSSVAAAAARGTSGPASIAVLPFVDLTEGMKQEEFADGLTEELIDRLIKIPGLRVPAPASTFYFKNKHPAIAEIARTLQVAYVLDGSVRKSGDRVRVAARLIRAGDTGVVWSETYDRPWKDILSVQDDIAGEVTKALKASIGGTPGAAPQ
jgi:TolB-like protein